jgi:alpha-glucosidase
MATQCPVGNFERASNWVFDSVRVDHKAPRVGAFVFSELLQIFIAFLLPGFHIISSHSIRSNLKIRKPVMINLKCIPLIKIIFTVILVFVTSLFAEYQFLGHVTAYAKEDRGLLLTCGADQVRINILAADLLQVRLARNAQWEDGPSYAVIKTQWPAVEWQMIAGEDELQIITAELMIKIQRKPCRLSFFDKLGNLINQDDPAFGIAWDGPEVGCYKKLFADEKFFGLGEKTGRLDKRGNEWVMWNSDIPGYTDQTDPLYQSHPFFIGVRTVGAYGIFFDNTYKTYFNMGAGNHRFYSFRAERGEMNYYYIFGPTIKKVITRYSELIGRMPLPPLWALGYQQCRWSYFPEAEVRTLAQTFRDKQIPCDVIYLDIHYMNGYRCFTWDKSRFPDPAKMLSDLRAQGFKIVVIIDPGIKVDPGYWVYEEGLKADHFVKFPDGQVYVGDVWPGPSHFANFTVPATRKWWGGLHRQFVEQGIAGFWNDMNEPAVWGKAVPDLVMFDEGNKKVSQKKIHNVFGHLMAQATYEGLRELRPNERPFILTRAGFAGTQRYAATWTGDNVATEEHLEMAIRMCLGLGLSGVPFVGSDVGGFIKTPSPELFARWIQVGAFTPLFRTHSEFNSSEQEPWSFGDWVEDIARQYIRLRYELMPYLYNALRQSAETGLPIMRPLFLEFQDDPQAYDWQNYTEYLFGEEILVAPVTRMGHRVKKVYLPTGPAGSPVTRWYDYWENKIYDGGKYIFVDAPPERLPLFVRAGAIIPSREAQNHVDEKPLTQLCLDVYPHHQSTRTFYEDDGRTFNYLQSDFCETSFTCIASNNQIDFMIGDRQGKFVPVSRKLVVRIHGQTEPPKGMLINQKRSETTAWQYFGEAGVVQIQLQDTGKAQQIRIMR